MLRTRIAQMDVFGLTGGMMRNRGSTDENLAIFGELNTTTATWMIMITTTSSFVTERSAKFRFTYISVSSEPFVAREPTPKWDRIVMPDTERASSRALLSSASSPTG